MPKNKDPEITIETITPAIAEEWLVHNTHNRPIRNRHVENLAGAIIRGEWKLNGDAIRFDKEGTLLDGQNRLWAVVLAEKSIQSMVIRGLSSDTQITMDYGQRRRLSDHLRLMGQTNSTHLAAAINLKWKLDNGLVRTSMVPTVPQALQVLKDHPQLAEGECLTIGTRWQRRLGGSPAVVALCYYEFSQADPDAAYTFFENLIEGVNLRSGSPLLALRRHVEASKVGSVMFFALLIKAWNAYIEGREVQQISWRPVGKNAEGFPQISKG